MLTPKRQWTALAVDESIGFSGRLKSYRENTMVGVIDDPPPPRDLLIDDENLASGENMEDWRKFREAGLLDVDSLERRDRDAMTKRIQRLESELYDYQHNMGLLLIEKKEWTLKVEQTQESLYEEHELLKREKLANLFAFAQAEERESNLKKALDAERQAAAELERSLREMHLEYEKIKTESATKLAEAKDLDAVVQDKSLEVQKKLLEAEAKLADASKKSIELERKSQEVVSRENVLKRERMSFNSERSAHEEAFLKHKGDMREWEAKLQEAEERHCQTRMHISERDEKINAFDENLKERNIELEKKRSELDLLNLELKKKQTEVFEKLAGLSAKEEKADSFRTKLEMKEKHLINLAESLNAREQVELQSLLDRQKTTLHVKEQEFELANEQNKKLLLQEHQAELDILNKKLVELNHVQEKLKKREEAVEKKTERVKEKEKDVQLILKDLKNKERTLNLEDKKLDCLRKEVDSEKVNLQNLNDGLENIKAEISLKQMQVDDETVKLKIAVDERREHIRLEVDLKHEIERYICKNDRLSRESDHIKEDRKKFEEEWDALDEKRVELTKMMQQLEEEKGLVENLKATEKQLNEHKIASKEHINTELEYLRLSKESFEVLMENERSALSKVAEKEHEQLLNEFENYRKELEAYMLEKKEEMERSMRSKEAALEQNIEKEKNNIVHFKEVLHRETEDATVEKKRLEHDKQTTAVAKQQLEVQQTKLQKDVNELISLSQKLKMHRQEFIEGREKFISFTESLRNCQHCGAMARDYTLSILDDAREVDDKLAPGEEILEKFAACDEVNAKRSASEDAPKSSSSSGGRISWLLQKCTPKIFSPKNVLQDLRSQKLDHAEIAGESSLPSGSFGLLYLPERLQDVEDSHGLRKHRNKTSEKCITRSSTAKTAIEDGEAFLQRKSGDLMPNTKQNKDDHPSSVNTEGNGDSTLAAKAARVPKKRKSSVVTGVDDEDHSEGPSETVTTGGRRKKHQKVVLPLPPVESTGKVRYNLRRHKIRGQGIDYPLVNGSKTDKEVGKAAALTQDHELSSEPREIVNSKYYGVQESRIHTNHKTDSGKSTGNVELNVISNYPDEKQKENSFSGSFQDMEYDVEVEEEENPAEASIQKKLWKF